jgi:hypothetical protein
MGAEFLHIWGSSPFASRIGCQNSLKRVFLHFDGFRELNAKCTFVFKYSKIHQEPNHFMTNCMVRHKVNISILFYFGCFKICEYKIKIVHTREKKRPSVLGVCMVGGSNSR